MCAELLGDISCIVLLARFNILHKNVHILIVVLFFNWVTVQEISLQRWVLNVEDIFVELLQLFVCHGLCIQGEVVS